MKVWGVKMWGVGVGVWRIGVGVQKGTMNYYDMFVYQLAN